MKKIAIVGFGNAGINCLSAFREVDKEASVEIFAGKGNSPASNPMLTTYYAGDRIDKEGMYPYGSADEIAEKYNAVIRYENVCGLDASAKQLKFENGSLESFDEILLATGAEPFIPVSGNVAEGKMFVMRTPGDAENLKDRLNPAPATAIVAGGSMVGIKVCEVLSKLGTKVVLADMAEVIFPLSAIKEVGVSIMKKLQDNGIELKFGSAMSSIEDSGDKVLAKFADGSSLVADIVCICIGTKTATGFLEGSGIEIDKGILVNDRMQTSAEGIYAAGDCVRMIGDASGIGLWANAAYQGRTAGFNMGGMPVHFSGNVPHNITHFMDIDFIGIGNPKADGEVVNIGVESCRDMYRAIINNGRILCVNILGNVRGSGLIRNVLTAKMRGQSVDITPEIQGMLAMQGFNDRFIGMLKKG